MKRIFLLLAILSLVSVLMVSPVLAKSPFVPPDYEPGTPLDYDDDGQVDAYYTIAEWEYDGGSIILVSYTNIKQHNKNKYFVASLGSELWAEGYGIIHDAFAPWTYPFPS